MPAVVAAGPRRRRHLHVRDDSTPGRQLPDEGRDQRSLGRELRPGRGAGRGEHRVHAFRPTTPRSPSPTSPRRHVLTVLAGHGHDNNVEWDGLRHDSRSDVYRTPGGAVEAGTPVTLRFRTFHDDVTVGPRPVLQPPPRRSADRPDVDRRGRRPVLPARARVGDLRLLAADHAALDRRPARQPVVPVHRERRHRAPPTTPTTPPALDGGLGRADLGRPSTRAGR